MLLISSILLGLSAQALAQGDGTITAAAAASTSLPDYGLGQCTSENAYNACINPLFTSCLPYAIATMTKEAYACGCAEAKSGLACYTSYCGPPTGSVVSSFLANSRTMCDGDSSPATETVQTMTTSKGTSPAGTTTTSKGTSPTATATTNQGTSQGTGTSAAVAGTTSKAAAGRAVVINSGSLVGGLGMVAGVVGWLF